jgi:hypothetical protein
MSNELWKEKRVRPGDVISAWVVVLIEVVIVLLISGMSASHSRKPNDVEVTHAALTVSLRELGQRESAAYISHAPGGVKNVSGRCG